MTLFLGLLTFLVILSILILIHEFGHFATAKLFGVRVDEFGLGFPPRVKGWKRGGTIYSINALPLGGFVRMLGENGEDNAPDSFGSKPHWQRFIILAAGPGMNILLALALFFSVFMAGSPRPITVITNVAPGSPAAAAGLHTGDRIVAENGQRTPYLEDLQRITDANLGHRVTLVVQRGSRTFQTSLVPRAHPPQNQGAMGIVLGKTATVSYGPVRSAQMAVHEIGLMVGSLPLIVQSISQHGTRDVSGPIGIAHDTTIAVQNEPATGPGSIILFVGVLSASLGVLNLLPIPALDGGRIIFVILSWIRRRNLDPQLEGLVHLTGMAVLLLLILVVSYNDLARWISGGS